MKYQSPLLIAFIVSLLLTGCSASEETAAKPPVSVYVTGMHEMYKIAYWKDGKRYPMENEGPSSFTTDIAVSEGKVYVSGYSSDVEFTRNVACYWVDGEQFVLGNSTDTTMAQAVAVLGNDVYTAGYQQTEAGTEAVYWKNGEIHVLNSGSNQAYALSIVISGDDIYICGSVMTPVPDEYYSRNRAAYWKNGLLHLLPEGGIESLANDIAVENSDVYVAGYNFIRSTGNQRKVVYWKNNELHELPSVSSPEDYYIEANGIAVENGQIYISGREFSYMFGQPQKGIYWINGEPVSITSGNKNAALLDIAVFEGNVFTTGMNDNRGIYWWNKKRLSLAGNQPFPTAITVVPLPD